MTNHMQNPNQTDNEENDNTQETNSTKNKILKKDLNQQGRNEARKDLNLHLQSLKTKDNNKKTSVNQTKDCREIKSKYRHDEDYNEDDGQIPPKMGWLKINIDASLIKEGFQGLGEIVGNEKGKTLNFNTRKSSWRSGFFCC